MSAATISLLVFLATAFLALAILSVFAAPREAARQRLAAYGRPTARRRPPARPGRPGVTSGLERRLAQADVALRPGEYRLILLGSVGAGLLIGLLLRRGPLAAAVLAGLGYLGPTLWLEFRRRARRRFLSRQVPEALTTISHALRSGYGLTQGMQAVATDLQPPIATEFARALKELALGASVEEVLQSLITRAQNEDLTIAITGILINREVGGNLAELLDRIAETIRERVKLQNHIRILTIQGKISGVLAGFFPTIMAGAFYILNPQYESILFRTPVGVLAIVIALTLQGIGAVMVWRIVNIEA